MDKRDFRAATFAKVDNGNFTFNHLRSVLIAGAGFFGDAYDIFVIGLALPMIYQVYYPPEGNDPREPSKYADEHYVGDSILKAATNWGNILGQLLFGFLGDSLGRRKVYGIELVVMLVAVIGSALSCSTVRGVDVFGMLAFWRFVLGTGIGGDYPLSATIISEFSHSSNRGMMIAAVFAMQGLGILAGGIITLLALVCFSSAIKSDIFQLDYVWRIILGFGAIPCAATAYYRFTMPESPRFREVAAMKVLKKAGIELQEEAGSGAELYRQTIRLETPQDSGSSTDARAGAHSKVVPPSSSGMSNSSESIDKNAPKHNDSLLKYLSNPHNALRLFATSYSWFALDVSWYGLTINTQRVLGILGFGSKKNSHQYDVLFRRAAGNVVIAIAGTVPGYWVTVFTIDKLGRKFIQILGFMVIGVILMALGIFWDFFAQENNQGTPLYLFLILFILAQFFFNFGPNETTFIYPAELFPTEFRARAHGISACMGKVGAIVGIHTATSYFSSNPKAILICFGLVMLSGGMVSFVLPETKNKTLEEITGDKRIEESRFEIRSGNERAAGL